MTAATGAPRRLSWRTLLVVFVTAAIMRKSMILTDVLVVAADLRQRGLIDAPASYSQLWDGIDYIAAALDCGYVVTHHSHALAANRHTGEVHECPSGCTGGTIVTREEFAARLCTASAFPSGDEARSTTFALDSTDLETSAARRSWERVPDVDTSSEEEVPTGTDSEQTFRTPGWPKVGYDGRLQHTIDLDAREGYRSGKNMRRKEVFIGYDIHGLTQTPEIGDGPIPHTILAVVTAPAGSSKAAAGLLGIRALQNTGHKVRHLLVDRGYSYLKAERWALPVRSLGVSPVHDLHSNQRGVHPGPIPHTLWIDGAVYSDALPKRLRKLDGFPLQQTPQQAAKRHELYDERAAYAYGTMGDPNPVTGDQRQRGPALRKTVRCVNNPQSMRLGFDKPLTDCIKGQACGCGKTVTVSGLDHARDRQDLLWGTTQWAASYGRRVAIESAWAELRSNRGLLFRRGFIHCRGAAKNHLLMTFAFVGLNVRILREEAIGQLRPDPWLKQIGDTSDPDWAALHGHRKRAPRKTALHQRIAEKDIPRRRVIDLRGTQKHRRAVREAAAARAAEQAAALARSLREADPRTPPAKPLR